MTYVPSNNTTTSYYAGTVDKPKKKKKADKKDNKKQRKVLDIDTNSSIMQVLRIYVIIINNLIKIDQ